MKEYLAELFTDACLFAFGVDLLYLYYAGVWYEPTKVILYTELALYYTLPLFAVWRFYHYGIKLLRR